MDRPLQLQVLLLAGAVLLFFQGDAAADDPVVELEIFELAKNDPGQQRVIADIVFDSILSAAAQIKADDLIRRKYLAHVNPDGFGPNYLVQALGTFLPVGYDNTRPGNNIESIFEDRGFGPPNAQLAWDGWLNSPSHRTHVLGEDAFFAKQIRVGVGIASFIPEEEENKLEKNIYVFFSVPEPPPGDVLPPNLSYVLPKAKSRPNRLMFHRGFVDDPSGIQRVQYRLSNRAWVEADFTPDPVFAMTGQWTGQTRLPRAFYRKARKGKKAIIIEVRAQDLAGNWSQTSRRFKKSRR